MVFAVIANKQLLQDVFDKAGNASGAILEDFVTASVIWAIALGVLALVSAVFYWQSHRSFCKVSKERDKLKKENDEEKQKQVEDAKSKDDIEVIKSRFLTDIFGSKTKAIEEANSGCACAAGSTLLFLAATIGLLLGCVWNVACAVAPKYYLLQTLVRDIFR